jgi:glutamine amidotransferase
VQTVAVVDTGSGNLRSVEKALLAAAARANCRREIRVGADPVFIGRADRVVLPGVGAFADTMAGLDRTPGLRAAVETRVRTDGAPFLGICVGLQVMAQAGVEFGRTPGLGWLSGEVRRLAPADPGLKIPHMGWNRLEGLAHPLFAKAWGGAEPDVYFTHSYALDAGPDVVATADYGGPVTAAAARDNLFGVQFHPEKSQTAGLALLAAWLDWSP